MAPSKPRRDWIYLFIVGTLLVSMLILDLVPLYPRALWERPGSPLHGLVSVRAAYVAWYGDPYAAAAHDALEPWFRFFIYLEGLVQLPLAAYIVYHFASSRPAHGPAELAALVFACITAITSSLCCFDLWHMGPERLGEAQKPTLLYGAYMPFAVIPAAMAVDMYLRLLARVRDDSPLKAKKKRP